MSNLLWEGVNLMVVGMGAVFVFLMLLVFTTSVMSALVARFLPQPNHPVVTETPTPARATGTDNSTLMAVITAAIHQHRSRHK
ncbi:oxaloacetate decarboxylase [Ketobacter sp. MCCC 1A13808]|uniref:OadG family protein n=1 Tax=Ketobacter sp. MCCC 1A13808 TaxID=2602738 RepID=UPI000F173B50|nr:OadG family protein [Ketobacter sp. MCCC 1A13808]MVF12793.1 oxaloacetate decarboxylase [Ketobacter sp. MCCC 1A13808]RLP54532.1 MAG: oxaloacetate decarboxylase [Ketobacter sp.]|tara:strand:- start:178 stop:426 length:249 start_codon:yes stop_codon:yes gene_type:complete